MIGPKSIEQALHISPAISNKMADAIELWGDMYEDKAPWLREPSFDNPTKVTSLGLPALIASEKARMATIEMKSEITAPTETITEENPNYVAPQVDELGNVVAVSGQPKTITSEKVLGPTERAEFMNDAYQNKLLTQLRVQLEYGIAKGGFVIKPYVVMAEDEDQTASIEFDFIQADGFYPISFDSSGNVIEAAFVDRIVEKDFVYSRLEYHKLDGHTLTIRNMAYKSTTGSTDSSSSVGDLGTEIPLTSISRWASLEPETTIKNVDRLMFAYFKMPQANTIDVTSPLGTSGYSRAVKLIEEADKQYSRLLWEFEGSELAIDIDRDALMDREIIDGNGVKRTVSTMGQLQQRLYRPIDLGTSDTYNVFAPTIRDGSLLNGLNSILMRIEDVCALSRGTISDAAAEARTATELKILKQRSYSSNTDIQKALESTLKDVVYIMNVYCTLYNIVGDAPVGSNGSVNDSKMGQYDVSFEWDDSILVDVDEELGKRITLMQNGLASKVETRMWYFGETETQARKALAEVDEESRAAMENNIMNQFEMASANEE